MNATRPLFSLKTQTVMTLARKHSKYNVSQQFVEMLLLQNKPWLVGYKRIRAMSLTDKFDVLRGRLLGNHNDLVREAEGCRRELKARNSVVQLCA